jgi:hypothetical protein
MRLSEEKPLHKMSPSELKRAHSASQTKDAKERAKEQRLNKSEAYRKYQERVQVYKEKRQQWLENQAAENKKRRDATKPSSDRGEVISSKDTDATATAKGISNAASVVGKLASLGGKALADRMRKKAEVRKAGEEKAGEKAKEINTAMKQKFLPPGRSGPEKIDKTRLQQPGSSRPSVPTPKPFTTGQRVRTSRRILPLGTTKTSESPISKIPSSKSSNTNSPKVNIAPKPESLGQRARRNANLKSKLIKARMEQYEYSCWREEFFYELAELRQKAKNKLKDEPIIDIMKGENKITIGPEVSESYDEGDETFRQHSRERFTASSGDDARKKRTSAVLKAMAAMNPPKGKKKKKKKEQ